MTGFVDPYLDAEHGCLRNLLGIVDPDELSTREHAIVAVRQRQLHQQSDTPPTTVADWRSVHRRLFGDIYDWAGEFRTVNVTKGTHTFHPVSHLHAAVDHCAARMEQIAALDRPDHTILATQLSELLSDMNETHPFREGNGRTQRSIIDRLAAHHDHPIAWKTIGADRNIELSIASGVDPHAFARPLRIAMITAREYDVSTTDIDHQTEPDPGLDL